MAWLAYYGSVQQLDRNSGNSALLLFLVIFHIFQATVVPVDPADEKLMIYMMEVYATMSSSIDPAISTIQ